MANWSGNGTLQAIGARGVPGTEVSDLVPADGSALSTSGGSLSTRTLSDCDKLSLKSHMSHSPRRRELIITAPSLQ